MLENMNEKFDSVALEIEKNPRIIGELCGKNTRLKEVFGKIGAHQMHFTNINLSSISDVEKELILFKNLNFDGGPFKGADPFYYAMKLLILSGEFDKFYRFGNPEPSNYPIFPVSMTSPVAREVCNSTLLAGVVAFGSLPDNVVRDNALLNTINKYAMCRAMTINTREIFEMTVARSPARKAVDLAERIYERELNKISDMARDPEKINELSKRYNMIFTYMKVDAHGPVFMKKSDSEYVFTMPTQGEIERGKKDLGDTVMALVGALYS